MPPLVPGCIIVCMYGLVSVNSILRLVLSSFFFFVLSYFVFLLFPPFLDMMSSMPLLRRKGDKERRHRSVQINHAGGWQSLDRQKGFHPVVWPSMPRSFAAPSASGRVPVRHRLLYCEAQLASTQQWLEFGNQSSQLEWCSRSCFYEFTTLAHRFPCKSSN